jgi:hypothetical protein
MEPSRTKIPIRKTSVGNPSIPAAVQVQRKQTGQRRWVKDSQAWQPEEQWIAATTNRDGRSPRSTERRWAVVNRGPNPVVDQWRLEERGPPDDGDVAWRRSGWGRPATEGRKQPQGKRRERTTVMKCKENFLESEKTLTLIFGSWYYVMNSTRIHLRTESPNIYMYMKGKYTKNPLKKYKANIHLTDIIDGF